jgi:hypothetical protein
MVAKKLTKGQREMLEDVAATPYGMMPKIGIAVGYGGSLASLVKHGLLEYRNGFYRITEAGRSAVGAVDA